MTDPSANSFQEGRPRADMSRGHTHDHPFPWTVSHEMNHRETPHLPAGVRRALHCLSLLLLPALAPDGAQALPRSRPPGSGPELRNPNALPYLPKVGAPPLRFQELAPPPDLASRPPAAAPPTPALSPTETSVALANAAAARSTVVATQEAAERIEAPAPATPAPELSTKAAPPAPAKTPPAILPDNARPTVRPEDFLPYFQIPGSARQAGDVTVIVPSAPATPNPAQLPPSSATYRQTPK